MRKAILLVCTLFLLYGCHTETLSRLKGKPNFNPEEFQQNYQTLINTIHVKTKQCDPEKLPAFLESSLVDSIFAYWYDTPWDFNGTTEKPREGTIACGYFVTTTLKHLGLNINRVHLAQQAASVIIDELCAKESVKTFSNGSFTKFAAYVRNYTGTIFIVGLDNHVGFLVKEKNEMYFIHSSGIPPYKVIKEKYDEARLLVNSKFHMIGHLHFGHWVKGLQEHE